MGGSKSSSKTTQNTTTLTDSFNQTFAPVDSLNKYINLNIASGGGPASAGTSQPFFTQQFEGTLTKLVPFAFLAVALLIIPKVIK